MFLIISALLQKLCVCFAPIPCLCITYVTHSMVAPVPVAAQSKTYVYGRSSAEIVGSNPTGGMDVCLL